MRDPLQVPQLLDYAPPAPRLARLGRPVIGIVLALSALKRRKKRPPSYDLPLALMGLLLNACRLVWVMASIHGLYHFYFWWI